MPRMLRWFPPDWGTGVLMLRSMDETAGRGAGAWLRAVTGLAAGFALGAVPALWFIKPLSSTTDSQVALGVMSALLAFGGLLVGFVASLMLFAGRLDNPARLKLEQAVAYRARLRYLLASQASTLVAALLLCGVCVVWMVMYGIHMPPVSLHVTGVAVFAFAGLCFVRMLLLPMQIFELHEESLDDAVARLEAEAKVRYAVPDDDG
jgi:hypothetical protein